MRAAAAHAALRFESHDFAIAALRQDQAAWDADRENAFAGPMQGDVESLLAFIESRTAFLRGIVRPGGERVRHWRNAQWSVHFHETDEGQERAEIVFSAAWGFDTDTAAPMQLPSCAMAGGVRRTSPGRSPIAIGWRTASADGTPPSFAILTERDGVMVMSGRIEGCAESPAIEAVVLFPHARAHEGDTIDVTEEER